MRSKTTTITAALALLLFTGCAEHGSYGGVESLKDAFVNAGGDCSDWDRHDAGELSEESGSCGDDAALSYFGDDSEGYGTSYASMQKLDVPMIVGDNWIIQTSFEDAGRGHKLAHDIGGIYDRGAYCW